MGCPSSLLWIADVLQLAQLSDQRQIRVGHLLSPLDFIVCCIMSIHLCTSTPKLIQHPTMIHLHLDSKSSYSVKQCLAANLTDVEQQLLQTPLYVPPTLSTDGSDSLAVVWSRFLSDCSHDMT